MQTSQQLLLFKIIWVISSVALKKGSLKEIRILKKAFCKKIKIFILSQEVKIIVCEEMLISIQIKHMNL